MERIEALLEGIPGYLGYRDLESRRDTDRRLRESIAKQLTSIAQRVERGGAILAQQRQLDQAAEVEGLVRQLNHAANRVRTQSYGYGGIFSDTPVDERALSQLYLFDKGLALKVDQLDTQLSTIESDLVSAEPVTGMVRDAEAGVRSVLDQLDTRGEVLETAAPASQRSIFEPLTGADQEEPPEPIDIGIGDAISHFDDDYLVDAVIEISDGANQARFLRIDSSKELWLAIADQGERLLAIVKEEDPAESQPVGVGPSSDDRTVQWQFSGPGRSVDIGGKPFKADALVTCYTFDSRSGDVAFRVISGTDERYLSGKRIHPDDLSVFGKPSKG